MIFKKNANTCAFLEILFTVPTINNTSTYNAPLELCWEKYGSSWE